MQQPPFTAADLRSLADHVASGRALCTHDLGGHVDSMLRAGADAIDGLAELRKYVPHIDYSNPEMTAARGPGNIEINNGVNHG